MFSSEWNYESEKSEKQKWFESLSDFDLLAEGFLLLPSHARQTKEQASVTCNTQVLGSQSITSRLTRVGHVTPSLAWFPLRGPTPCSMAEAWKSELGSHLPRKDAAGSPGGVKGWSLKHWSVVRKAWGLVLDLFPSV